MKRNKASYVGGAAALLVSSVTVKILGALFKMPRLWTDRCRAVPADHCAGCVSCDDRGCFARLVSRYRQYGSDCCLAGCRGNGQADRWFGCGRVSAARRLWYNRCSGRCRVRRDLRRIARRIVPDMACAARCDSYAAASARTVERFF